MSRVENKVLDLRGILIIVLSVLLMSFYVGVVVLYKLV